MAESQQPNQDQNNSSNRKSSFVMRSRHATIFVSGKTFHKKPKKNDVVVCVKGKRLRVLNVTVSNDKKYLRIRLKADDMGACPTVLQSKQEPEKEPKKVTFPVTGETCDVTVTVDDEDYEFEEEIDDPEPNQPDPVEPEDPDDDDGPSN